MTAKPIFNTLALIGKYRSAEAAATVLSLARALASQAGRILIERETASLGDATGLPCEDLPKLGQHADLAIVVGGDGTLLHAARALAPFGVPVVGVNQGRVGFMTDIPREEALAAVSEILAGHYRAGQRALLDAQVLRDGAVVAQSLALNEVVVSKSDGGRMVEFALTIDDEFIYNQRSDGLIVATATGSTGYALSANGPILHPGVSGMALVPLCAHALTARPITVPESSRLAITLAENHEARLHCDGHTQFDLRGGDAVRIARAACSLTLLHPLRYSYFAMLREKLNWSEPARAAR